MSVSETRNLPKRTKKMNKRIQLMDLDLDNRVMVVQTPTSWDFVHESYGSDGKKKPENRVICDAEADAVALFVTACDFYLAGLKSGRRD